MRPTYCPRILACVALTAIMLSGGPALRAADIAGNVTITAPSAENQDFTRAVVFLDADPALASPPKANEPRPQIVQRGKAFVPDLLVVAAGTTVEFPNWDPFSHNVFSRSAAASFDLERYGQGKSKSVTFRNAGLVQIFCNIHPQMKASLLVAPNRCFARVDAQGRFVIRDVPSGQFVMIGWDLRAGEQRQTIVVPPQGLAGVMVRLPGGATREAAAVEPPEPSNRAPGVERGLGVKRERLYLPLVEDVHPAPPPLPNQ
jgi:plastocyanin